MYAFMEKIGIIEMMAPLADSDELTLQIQKRDERAFELIHTASLHGLTATKCSALHISAQVNFERLMDYLISQNLVSINALDCGSNTPLHYAAKSGSIEPVIMLLSRGADILAKNSDKKTACM